jgi:transketolase
MRFGFDAPALSADLIATLEARRKRIAADVIRLTSLANSGHPGGSLSTIDALSVLYACGTFDPARPHAPERDRVIVSHGHISPGVYGTLAEYGYFDIEEAYRGFRAAGSCFGGHIETVVPGVEWNTGNLGQGLSAGAGFAAAAKLKGDAYQVFVGMGDGEQQKGQVAEARRFAAKFKLDNLIAFVDVNRLQIGGKTDDVMPMDLAAQWRADGWQVLDVEGHDFAALYAAFRTAVQNTSGVPIVLLLHTTMGFGVSEIEDDHNYHGQALSPAMASRAFAELGAENNLEALAAQRKEGYPHRAHDIVWPRDIQLDVGTPETYGVDVTTDCRSAYGKALEQLGALNNGVDGHWPVVGISCDLEGSVKMNAFHAGSPSHFFEAGIMEHNAAVVAGAMSTQGVVPFWSTFGMFALVEAYNQQRLNDQNQAAPKVVVTHCGLDVGEDGPTHQCIDYVSLLSNPFGLEVYVPADPNECDRIVRTVATRYAPTAVAMGRSKMKTIATRDGKPALGGDATFTPGEWSVLRPGDDAVVFAFGPMVARAVEASDALFADGFGLRVVNASSLKPFDRACIERCAREVGRLLTYEDHNVHTGLGAIVAGALGDAGIGAKLKRLGVSRYGTSGKPDDLFAEQGLAPSDLIAAARALVD